METQQQAGPAGTTELPGNGPQQVAQFAPNPASVPENEAPNQENAPPAAPADWQEQLSQARQQAQQHEQRFRETQAAYTRSQQALAQLGATPPPPPQDPLAPYIQDYMAQGFLEKDARAAASVQYKMAQSLVAPLQQQNQQLQQQLQGIPMVDSVMQQVYSANPQLFSNTAVYEQTKRDLTSTVMGGGHIDLQFAEFAAVIADYQASKSRPGQQPQQVQQSIPQPWQHGAFRPSPGYPPQQPVAQALNADQLAADAFFKNRYPQNK